MSLVNHRCVICDEPRTEFRATCGSAECHEALVERMEKRFGRDKIVVDSVTGTKYLVPTRYIAEFGLQWTDLTRFPVVQ